MPTASRGSRQLHYETTGDGPAVILIPGIGSGSRQFGTLPRRFAKEGFCCISFDPIGVAPSSAHHGPYDLDAAARDIVAIADQLELAQFDLVGVSLGGKISLIASTLAQQRVRRMVLLASAAVSSPRSQRIYRFFEILTRRLQPEEIGEVLAAFLFGRTFHATRPKVVADIVRSMQFDTPTRELMIAQASCLQGFDGRSIAAAVACPTLCLAGAEDTLTNQEEVETTAELIVDSRFEVIPKAGHSLLLEAAEVLGRTIAFLREG